MLKTVTIVAPCANPECNAGVSFGTIVTDDVPAWIETFEPKKVKCVQCGFLALYSRDDLQQVVLTDGSEKENKPGPSS